VSSVPENVPAEEAAWAEVLEAWDDEARHRAYLDGFSNLEGLVSLPRTAPPAERPRTLVRALVSWYAVQRLGGLVGAHP